MNRKTQKPDIPPTGCGEAGVARAVTRMTTSMPNANASTHHGIAR
jgi:hypothetical protein